MTHYPKSIFLHPEEALAHATKYGPSDREPVTVGEDCVEYVLRAENNKSDEEYRLLQELHLEDTFVPREDHVEYVLRDNCPKPVRNLGGLSWFEVALHEKCVEASSYRQERDALQAKLDEAIAALQCVRDTTHHPVELIAIARATLAKLEKDT